MANSRSSQTLLGGRLAIDFANAPAFPGMSARELSWEEFVAFLEASQVISQDRSLSLLALPGSDPQAANLVLSRAIRLKHALRNTFHSLLNKERIPRDSIEAINEILRITEGHDELVEQAGQWKLEFIARESGLEWLLAAVARSAAEIIADSVEGRLRLCANPGCGLFFWDNSKTQRRRWCSMAICGNRHKVARFARRRTPA